MRWINWFFRKQPSGCTRKVSVVRKWNRESTVEKQNHASSWKEYKIWKYIYMLNMSKKKFSLGGMALSMWIWTVRAVRDIPVGADFAPSINTMCHAAYRPPIVVSPLLLTLSLFYFKRKLWHYSQLCPYVRMDSLGMYLHGNCNAMGDPAETSSHVPSTCSQDAILSSYRRV
jgi:hypothetical protein